MAKIQKTKNMRYLWKYRRNGILIHCWYESILEQPLWESFRQCLIKLNGGSVGKESTCNSETACSAGNLGKISGSGTPPGEGNGNPLQYSCLGNPRQRSLEGYSPWVCSQTWCSDYTTTTTTEAEYIQITYPPLLEMCQCTYQKCVQVYRKNVF